jgi:antirestriction protein ArdC
LKLILYESVTLKIIQSLENGVVPWKKLWHSTASLPVSFTTGKPYRGVNLFLLGLAPNIDHRWITFRQVRERGGSIKSDEKATMVVFWIL